MIRNVSHLLGEAALIKNAKRSTMSSLSEAMSYGPWGYAQSLAVGLIVGTVIFMFAAAVTRANSVFAQKPAMVLFAVAGAALGIAYGATVNFLIGRRIRDELERQRAIFGEWTEPARPLSGPSKDIELMRSRETLQELS